MFSLKLDNLVKSLTRFPSIGTKTAQRLAIHLLQNDRESGLIIANALQDAITNIGNCSSCRNLTENNICEICSNSARDDEVICVVENPIDVIAVEQSTNFKGKYFVLMGHISPLDGIGPEEIGLDLLQKKLQEQGVKELILATNITAEGDATAYYISEMASEFNTIVSRITYGVPMGGELEYIDRNTLGHAFSTRTKLVD